MNRVATDSAHLVGWSSQAPSVAVTGEWIAPSSSFTDLKRAALLGALSDTVYRESEVEADPRSILLAREFLQQLPIEVTMPDIVVEADGAVAFDWDVAPRSTFTVSLLPDGRLRYGGLFGTDTHYGTVRLRSAIPSDVLAFIERARRGGQ